MHAPTTSVSCTQVAIKVMPKQRGKLSRDRTLQKLAKEVGGVCGIISSSCCFQVLFLAWVSACPQKAAAGVLQGQHADTLI